MTIVSGGSFRDSTQAPSSLAPLSDRVAKDAFAFIAAEAMRPLIGSSDALFDWPHFVDSWNDLQLDTYLPDGHRYRRRRHATLSARTGEDKVTLEPHQPHYQSIDYNPLVGGIERWFEPGRELLVVGDADEAVAAYRELLDDPLRAEELGRAARERALDEHTYLQRARRLLELVGLGEPARAVAGG